MNYQKVYMNQIHSSSLLCQLAQMWRSQLVCDAYIRTGTVTTKAHRVVLLAACPMLQSMEKASIGSHLEVRLTADIKQEAVNMFLQYLYEGFMLLTEENCKDVEKVARLLQVDSVIKCCADFYKCLESKTGNNMYSNSKYKYSSYDMLEFRHVRATDLQKTVQDRLMKRASEMGRPLSPSSKKQRLYRASTPPSESSQSSFSQRADDTFSMSHSYGSGQQEPWDRVPRPGANAASMSRGQSQRFQQPSVIDIVEDSIELIHVDPGDGSSHQPPSQKGVAVSVASQMDSGPPNISIVNVTGNTGPPHGPSPSQGHSQRQTSGPSYSSPHVPSSSSYTPRHSSVSSSPSQSKASDRAIISLTDPQISQITREVTHQLQQQEHSASSSRPPALQLAPGLTSPHESLSQQRPPHFPFTERLQQTASKPSFAAGSARQVGPPQMPNLHSGSSSTGSPSTLRPDRSPSLSGRSDSMDRPPSVEASKDSSKQKNEDSSTASSTDLMADITIIKVETGDETMSKEHKDSGQPGHSSDGVIHSTDHSGLLSGDTTGGLDMHVDAPDDGGTMTMQIQRNDDGMGQEGDSDIEELEATGDWPHDSNDDSSLSNDPNNPLGGFRGTNRHRRPLDSGKSKMEADIDRDNSLAPAEGDANTMKSGYPISSGQRFTLNLPNMTRPPPPFPILPNITHPPPPYPLSLESSPNFMEFQSRPMYFQSSSSIVHGMPVPSQFPDHSQGIAPKEQLQHTTGMSTPTMVAEPVHPSTDPLVDPDGTASSAPVVVKKKAIILKGLDDLPGHKIVPNDIKNGARCTYCQVHRIKTPSGWRVKTNYKCETCDVALCASEVCERNCFHLHHVEMFGEQILGDKAQ